MKAQILAALGERELQPAAALNAALAANDRVKYLFSLLQMALDHAEHPEHPAATLKRERNACGIDDPDLDGAVASARKVGAKCRVQGARNILARITADMRLMAAPVGGAKSDAFGSRLEGLLAVMPGTQDDLVDPAVLSAMMAAGHDGPDSLHRLVMDLHKRLNAMQAELAEETLDGAAAYNLAEADRPLVRAFMAGIDRTARLKFNHPGLATTATRVGNRLIIQNDIGTTDAHVIVIHVEGLQAGGLAVAVTYTDVHVERLGFFQDMLKPFKVIWEKQRTDALSAGSAFYLATGRLEAADDAAARDYLTFLGSRLVFLIDWNHARKQLRGFLRGADRLVLLSWAAEAEIGHRGFLELGGARLVNQNIEAVAGLSMHFGDRLCDVLGDAETLDFLRFVFKTATQGLLSDESAALLRDRIKVALAAHFSNEQRQLLRVAQDHAGLIFELASLARDALRADPGDDGKHAEKCARRARAFEHDADRLVIETRASVARRPDYAVFLQVVRTADDAADELEDAVALMGFDALKGKPLAVLQGLADQLVEAAQEWIKALGHASQIGRAASGAETQDFLTAIDRIAALEHEADDAQRALTASAVRHAEDFRQLHLFTAIGDRLENASDALQRASLILHEHMLEDVING
ncbi:uncharacterized protein Yka (UPF0111/DUF47 family) [Rhodoblastus sphagnicola]|nr:DUF47 family protein [Rhodoblastus sphagnicola]MBB4196655.1 uncharacterized protein Yka (UPF0111/DUF47 family) [Rhodoblastus sphagnicola]